MPSYLDLKESYIMLDFIKNQKRSIFPFDTGSLFAKTQIGQMMPNGFELIVGVNGETNAGRNPSHYASYLEYSDKSKHKGWLKEALNDYCKDAEQRFNQKKELEGDDEDV